MAYASFNQKERPINNAVNEPSFNKTKALGRVYGYMALGLGITAVVCLGVSWLFSSHINEVLALGNKGAATPWVIALIATWIVSAFTLLVLSFVIPVKAAFGKGSLWFPYILYAVCMGALLSVVLLSGISLTIVAEAFGITALAFAGMAIIGWRSKKDLSLLGFIAFSLLWGVLLISLLGVITLALTGWNATAAFWFDVGIQSLIVLILLIVTMVDSWRIKKILEASGECNNMYLYGAFVMYSDFIAVFIRILYILAKLRRN